MSERMDYLNFAISATFHPLLESECDLWESWVCFETPARYFIQQNSELSYA